ncbi:MAG: hypothetical protein HQL70_10120 [Magnetococcales bacterium]|nr:hypothetical protein [Magnetococcales bacterium]
MSELNAGFTLDFLSQQKRSSFLLVFGDDLGSSPIQVRPQVVKAWSRDPDLHAEQMVNSLQMVKPGKRRVRLYCSKETAQSAKVKIYSGSASSVGRRQERVLETLTWTNKTSQSLKFPYDNPTAVVVDKTSFFNQSGEEVEPPTYIPNQGIFHHSQTVTGAVVVEYSPEFSLFEVEYDMGEMDAERLIEMKLAWLAGNIRDCDIPPVHVVAIADGHAAQISFQRQFWPERTHGKNGYVAAPVIPSRTQLSGGEGLDPCWNSCWQQINGGELDMSMDEYLAIVECVKMSNEQPQLQYVEISRETKTERIFNNNDSEIYIDVERPTLLTMKLSRADGKEFCGEWENYAYLPEIIFRFNG